MELNRVDGIGGPFTIRYRSRCSAELEGESLLMNSDKGNDQASFFPGIAPYLTLLRTLGISL